MHSNSAPMPPMSGPLKLFMEDIEKTQSLYFKCVKLHAYIETIKEEKNTIKDLNVPLSKQILDDAIRTLEVEHDKFLAKIKDILNRLGIADVNVSPEEMIRVFQNLSLAPTNTVVQPAPMQMQQGLGQQGSLQMLMQMQQQQQQSLLQRQQGLGQLPF